MRTFGTAADVVVFRHVPHDDMQLIDAVGDSGGVQRIVSNGAELRVPIEAQVVPSAEYSYVTDWSPDA
jgi:hypothetical protein